MIENTKLSNQVQKNKSYDIALMLKDDYPYLSALFTDSQVITYFDAMAKIIENCRYRDLPKIFSNPTVLCTLDELFDAPAECREMLDDITVRVDFRDFEGTRISNILHTIRQFRDMFLVVEKMNWTKEQTA